jgi:hypothetical protein
MSRNSSYMNFISSHSNNIHALEQLRSIKYKASSLSQVKYEYMTCELCSWNPPPPPHGTQWWNSMNCLVFMWYATSASIASSNQIMNSAVCEEDADIVTFQLSITESFTLFWSISLSVRWKGLIPTYHLLSLFMLTLKACVLDHGKILGGRLLFQSGY